MGTLDYLQQGFGVALSPYNLATALAGTLIGTVVGLLPGLGPINGVALLIPIAYAMGLPPESALILLAAVYLGCEYGGRISSILLNIPGEASAVMTTLDGYPLAQQGKAGIALSISAWSSFVGGLMATIGVVLFAPLLAKWAVAVGPAEYFVLVVFALTCLAGMAGNKPLKTAIACCIGLFLSCIGIDSGSGVYRFTFGSLGLADGIQFVVCSNAAIKGKKPLSRAGACCLTSKKAQPCWRLTCAAARWALAWGFCPAQAQPLPARWPI